MSLQTRLTDWVAAVGADIKAHRQRLDAAGISSTGTITATGAITRAVPSGPVLSTGFIVLSASAAVPANTPAGTLIVRLP